ncbi:MAG TPA: hypothetical protein VIJ14_01415 [Rhabdochlamydiaceae bacterium]
MAESKEHKREKIKAAGKHGKTEVPLKGGQRLDALNRNNATEVERSGTKKGLLKSIARLEKIKGKDKEQVVPPKDVAKAKKLIGDRFIKVKAIK